MSFGDNCKPGRVQQVQMPVDHLAAYDDGLGSRCNLRVFGFQFRYSDTQYVIAGALVNFDRGPQQAPAWSRDRLS